MCVTGDFLTPAAHDVDVVFASNGLPNTAHVEMSDERRPDKNLLAKELVVDGVETVIDSVTDICAK